MRFGEEPVVAARGALLAHSVRLDGELLRKGHVLTDADIARMVRAGLSTATVARLEAGDVPEDDAARRVAETLIGHGIALVAPGTGRVNLTATVSGLMRVDRAGVDALNLVTEEVTLATLPDLAPVQSGDRVATVKIIPFAVPELRLATCVSAAAAARVAMQPFRPLAARLIQTLHAGLKPSILDKTAGVTAERLSRIGCRLIAESRCSHDIGQLAAAMAADLEAGTDLLLVIGASAIVDRRDVIPAAIERLGGRIERLGMPVDPGNLILVGEIASRPVLGLPGCARSPVRNGLDWVIERISAGVPVEHAGIARMGVGGLLIGRDDEKDYL